MADASTAAPRRMRAPDRLPSRSAATTNGAVASGSSSATHAPVPLRSWNWPGRRRAAEAVGEPDEQRRAGVVGIDGVEVEADPGPPGDVGRPLAHPAAARRSARSSPTRPATASTRRARSAGARSRDVRTTSRSSTTAATTHDSVSGRPTIMRARRGWTGSPTIRRPERGDRPGTVDARRGRRAARPPGAWPSAAAGRRTTARSAGVPQAASSSTSPARSTWVISAARWAGRVPCSMRLHSR